MAGYTKLWYIGEWNVMEVVVMVNKRARTAREPLHVLYQVQIHYRHEETIKSLIPPGTGNNHIWHWKVSDTTVDNIIHFVEDESGKGKNGNTCHSNFICAITIKGSHPMLILWILRKLSSI